MSSTRIVGYRGLAKNDRKSNLSETSEQFSVPVTCFGEVCSLSCLPSTN